MSASTETVLVVGATGNIGVSAVIAALRSGRKVLAIVRNEKSAEKLFKAVGSRDNITTVEASIVDENGTKSVVDKVRAGELPPFHHVYIAAGGSYPATSLLEADLTQLRHDMNINFEAPFLAYNATVPYLLAQAHPTSTFTVCTGASGDLGARALPGITQGALFSLLNSAGWELRDSNIRLVEVYLARRVEIDSDADAHGVMRASDFGKTYEAILAQPELRDVRVYVKEDRDVDSLRWRRRAEVVDVFAFAPLGAKDADDARTISGIVGQKVN